MAALTEMLRKASLRKEDLDLELEELEAAAQMVVEDEEEVGVGESGLISCSSSSSSSSDESQASEAEEACAEGGRGRGGGTCKDNPLQPRHGSSASPIPHKPSSTLVSPARTADALPAVSDGCRRLIQELEERVAEELKICPDSRDTPEGGCSPPDGAVGTLLEPSPRRNPLLIVTEQEDV